MRQEASLARGLVASHDNASILADPFLSRALALSFVVIGEAAVQTPKSFRDAYPLMPWDQARALRNRIVHGYRLIVPDILIDTAREDLPKLIAEIDRILAEGEETP